jgi:AcrR family transcriptional regulator
VVDRLHGLCQQSSIVRIRLGDFLEHVLAFWLRCVHNMRNHSLSKLAFMPTAPRKSANALAPRKLPRQARSAATVQAILEAAAHILEVDGMAACTTNAVALKAGVSIGSLYQYFPSRDAITKTLILEKTTALLEEVEAISLQDGGRSALVQLVDVGIAQQLTRPTLARILDVEEQRLPIEADLRSHMMRLHTFMAALLAQPDLPPSAREPDVAADIVAIIRGMVDGAGGRGERDVAALRRRVQRAVFGYLDAEPAVSMSPGQHIAP